MTQPILVSGKARGAERCLGIVTDEQRRLAPKSARREAVARSDGLAASRRLRVAPLRDCATFLASPSLRAITTTS